MPNLLKTRSYRNWLDIVLPYRLWLKKKYSSRISFIQEKLLPKTYSVQHVLLAYRKQISKVNQDVTLSVDLTQAKASLKKEFEDINTYSYKENTPYIVAGGEAMAFLGHDVYTSYQAVDEYVYEGMSRMTGENLDNIADLSTKVQSYKHSFWEGLPDAGINKVGGHIGEAYSASSLQEKGIGVEWAQESNQIGWDLLVNGHEMNVKTVADAHSLSKHFNQYPDIPAIIPGDASNISENAINIGSESGIEQLNQALLEGSENLVVVDPSLSNQEIMEQTAEATDFLTGSIDIFNVYIPILTVGLSGFREYRLIAKGDTSLFNAAKNIGLDVLGTGGGAILGASIGASVGSVIPGPGTAIGGFVGGAAGAIYGRFSANSIKKKAFKKAYAAFIKQRESFENSKSLFLKSANQSINDFKTVQSRRLHQEKKKYQSEIVKMAEAMKLAREKQYRLSSKELAIWKDKGLQEIDSYTLFFNARIEERSTLKAIFNPGAEDFALYNASIAVQRLKEDLLSFDVKRGRNIELRLIKLCAEIGVLKETVLKFITDRELERYVQEVNYRNKIDSSIGALVEKRHSAIIEISEYITAKTNDVQGALKKEAQLVLEKMELVNIEKRKLGLK